MARWKTSEQPWSWIHWQVQVQPTDPDESREDFNEILLMVCENAHQKGKSLEKNFFWCIMFLMKETCKLFSSNASEKWNKLIFKIWAWFIKFQCKLRACAQVWKEMEVFSGPLYYINRVRILGQRWILKFSSNARPPSPAPRPFQPLRENPQVWELTYTCLLYTSDAADE